MLFTLGSHYQIMFVDGEEVYFNVISNSAESFLQDRIKISGTGDIKTVRDLLNKDWLSLNQINNPEKMNGLTDSQP